jgi:protein-S-isoprenylcysteine O-methyltransferase Ste14
MVKIISMPARQGRHHWSDWVGFLFCLWLILALIRRSAVAGIIVMMLPACMHDIVAGIAFLVRRPARAHLAGWVPRIATYGSTFLIPAFLALAGSHRPSWVAFTPVAWAVSAGYCVWTVGVLLAVWTVWQLRHSFSLAPQARELVRTGPYRLARHPIYAAYLLQYIGILCGHMTAPFAIAVLGWLGLIAVRIHYEEMVLENTFPQYAQYRQRVGMFAPRLHPRTGGSSDLGPHTSTGTLSNRTLASALPGSGCTMETAGSAPQRAWHENY